MPKRGKMPRQAFCSGNCKTILIILRQNLCRPQLTGPQYISPGKQQKLIFKISSELSCAFMMFSFPTLSPFPHQYTQYWEQPLESQVTLWGYLWEEGPRDKRETKAGGYPLQNLPKDWWMTSMMGRITSASFSLDSLEHCLLSFCLPSWALASCQ